MQFIIPHHDSKPDQGFEYQDHPSDIILYSWAITPQQAMAQAGLALYNYIAPLGQFSTPISHTITVTGADLPDLFYYFLDELLNLHNFDYFIGKIITPTIFSPPEPQTATLTALVVGEIFNPSHHQAGTEVKAVTMHGNSVQQDSSGLWHCHALVDI